MMQEEVTACLRLEVAVVADADAVVGVIVGMDCVEWHSVSYDAVQRTKQNEAKLYHWRR